MQQERRQWMKEIALLAAVAGGLAMPASHAQAQTLRLLSSNGNRWRGLSEQQQKWLLDAGQRTEVEAARVGNEIVAEERAKLAEHGVQVARLPDDKGKMIQDVWRSTSNT